MANYRDRRVGQEILKEVNDILRKKVRDPRGERNDHRCESYGGLTASNDLLQHFI